MRLLHGARLSKQRDDSTAVEKQDEQASKYAAVHDHEIVATAPDTDVSGSTDPMKRPKLGPYLTDAALRSTYDGIIFSALDRAGRNARHLMELRDWAEDNGKVLIVISPALQWPPADENDFASPIIWDILGRLAEYELAAITKRNRETQKWLRDNGYLEGKPPFGFTVVDKDNHKTLAPDPELSPVIRELAERYLAGASLADLANWLDSEEIKPLSSEVWAPNSLRRFLANPALMGRRKDAQGRTILKFEPILDEVTFRRVQAELERRAKRRGAPSDESLLSGIIYCANCNGPMGFHKAYSKLASGEKSYHCYYRCHGTAKQPSRCKNMITVKFADDAMSGWVTDVIGGQEMNVREVIPGHDHSEEIADVDAAIAALDQDDSDYDQRHAELRAERKRLRDLPMVPASVTEKPSGKVKDFWESMDSTEVKREWLKAGQVKIEAYKPPVKGAAPEGAPPFTFTIEALFGGDWSIPVGRWAEGVADSRARGGT